MAGFYTQQDIQMTDTGDFLVDPTGDFALADIDQTTRQDALLYLYTEYGDFSARPDMGSRVNDFIGEPNSSSNAQLLKAELLRALTSGGRFSTRDVAIRIVPISVDEILAYVTIQNGALAGSSSIIFDFNYIKGIQVFN
jgi:phage baseplate assembly protein W